ncbi:hypothetical protein BGZ94_008478 [Podila epigama]|nr:hypothetical protein BGZ94_008478 [Podila epigama]
MGSSTKDRSDNSLASLGGAHGFSGLGQGSPSAAFEVRVIGNPPSLHSSENIKTSPSTDSYSYTSSSNLNDRSGSSSRKHLIGYNNHESSFSGHPSSLSHAPKHKTGTSNNDGTGTFSSLGGATGVGADLGAAPLPTSPPTSPTSPPQSPPTQTPRPAQKRLQSLDILRGVTIILMILVNTQGADPFVQLMHPAWFGFTMADWVFPNFIFMVGMAVAIVFSPSRVQAMIKITPPPLPTQDTLTSPEMNEMQEIQGMETGHSRRFSGRGRGARGGRGGSGLKGDKGGILQFNGWRTFGQRHQARLKANLKILKRSLILFALGMVLAAVELINTPWADVWIRVPGVLQRISFCYFILTTTVLWAPLVYTTGSGASPSGTLSDSGKVPHQSRVVMFGLPIVFTALWFALTYGIQSTATEPIEGCLYPDSAYIQPDGSVGTVPHGPPKRGQLSPPLCTAQSYLDTLLFGRGRDPNNPMFDAEGTLGSLTAVVTAWFGWIVGSWVVEQQRLQKMNEKYLAETVSKAEEAEELEAMEVRSGHGGSPSSRSGNSDVSPTKVHLLRPTTGAESTFALSSRLSSAWARQRWVEEERRRFLLSYLGEWFMVGVCLMFAGSMMDWFLPNMKALWTPSYTLYTAGISTNMLCLLMYLYDLPSIPSTVSVSEEENEQYGLRTRPSTGRRILDFLGRARSATNRFITRLLICYGRNPTLIYMLSELIQILLQRIPASDASMDWVSNVWAFVFFNTFFKFMPPAWASVVFSTVYIILFAPLLWILDSKGLYLRV